MPHARKAQEEHRPPLASADRAAGRQRIVAVGVVQHPTTGHCDTLLGLKSRSFLLIASHSHR